MRKPKLDRPEEQQRFETFLRSRQLKLTGERLELVEEVFQQPHHFDADQLHMAPKLLFRTRPHCTSRSRVR